MATCLTVTCTGSSANFPARGGLVTIRFPLAAGGTADATGLIDGSGGANVTIVVPLLPPPLPPLPPPPLLPPLVPVLIPAPPPPVGVEAPPEVPVIPEADSVTLVGWRLAMVVLLVALRRARRRRAPAVRGPEDIATTQFVDDQERTGLLQRLWGADLPPR